MRTFVIIKGGIARIMRTYALDPGRGRVLPNAPGAPDAQDIIAKWHPDHQAAVTGVREINDSDIPSLAAFKDGWRDDGVNITIDMPTARETHADHIAIAQAAEIARLKVEERKERLKSNTAQADDHAATVIALEALDLNVLATQIAAAPNTTALDAIWPAQVPR